MTEERKSRACGPAYGGDDQKCPFLGVYQSDIYKIFACAAQGRVLGQDVRSWSGCSTVAGGLTHRPCDATVQQVWEATDRMTHDSHAAREMFPQCTGQVARGAPTAASQSTRETCATSTTLRCTAAWGARRVRRASGR
jgi:hypothetical protein